MSPNDWSGPGIDNDGLYFPHRAHMHFYGAYPSEWLTDTGYPFTFAAWIKLPPDCTDRVVLFSYGRGTTDSPGFLMTFDGKTNDIIVEFYTTFESYTNIFTASDLGVS